MDYFLFFNPSRLFISPLNIYIYIYFFFFFFSSLSLSLSLLTFPLRLSYLFQIWPYERLQLLHPTIGNDLEAALKWVYIAKKAYKKSSQKKERLINHLDMPQILLFYTLWFSCLFLWNSLSSFTLSNERTIHLLSLLIVIIIFFFFSFFHAM